MFQVRGSLLLLFTVLTLSNLSAAEIQNGLVPKGKPVTMTLVEDLRLIPKVDDDHYVWPGELIQVIPSPKGEFLVVLPGSNVMYLYDAKGTFVKEVGGPGEGPGQFQNLSNFQFLNSGSVAFEILGPTCGLSFFDDSLVYKEKKQLRCPTMVLEAATLSPDGKLVASSGVRIDRETGDYFNRGAILSETLEEKLLIFEAKPTKGFDRARMGQAEYWVEFMSERFKPIARGEKENYAFDKQGNIYVALTHTYKITVYDKNLKELRTITKKYTPAPFPIDELNAFAEPMTEGIKEQLPPNLKEFISAERVNRALEKAEFPPGKHPVHGISVTDQGYLLVLTQENYIKGTTKVDIFNPAGEYVGQFERDLWEMERMNFANGLAYAATRNEEGDNVPVRYRYTIEPAK